MAVDKFAVASRARWPASAWPSRSTSWTYLPEEWGYDGAADRAARSRRSTRPPPTGTPRRRARAIARPLDEGPWYVVECVPAITFPFHGIRIDTRARVLGHDGRPIPGLLCAGSDTGGLYDRAYAGGLASALVFGLTAAEAVDGTR